ncbi:MAG: cyclopropane-fatty-acyl-phospholipid synthase [Gammaproteobacteria bacterium]|nr:MAG: cyclopropane-fatty-acyl-phospholipid synthase [Gammaproteobacteria bacterium]
MSSKVTRYRATVEDILQRCDIRLDGEREQDMIVHDEAMFGRVVHDGSLGFGEAYMDGQWDCLRVDCLIDNLLSHREGYKLHKGIKEVLFDLQSSYINCQTKIRSLIVGRQHYDVGNDLYEAMLDPHMMYSCAYWNGQTNLNDAQECKLDMVCQKLELKPDMTLLDIGCGWGGMARFAAEKYGVTVVGVTISREQQRFAQERCAGYPVDIRFQDYRELEGEFDRIVSIGMFEHVGYKNYRTYFNKCHALLKDKGLFLLHTIGSNKTVTNGDAWLEKYIFPYGMLPSVKQMGDAAEPLWVLEDWHNFGSDYDRTLMAWHQNISVRWQDLGDRYDQRFKRMWDYYLLSCAGVFRSRYSQLWQIVFSKGVRKQRYDRPCI